MKRLLPVGCGYGSRRILESFDYARPGFGGDDYLSDPADHAMAYGVYACAAYEAGKTERANIARDWLIKESRPGWGLPFAWKSFGIEPENPISTVYGITVAWGVRALIASYAATGHRRSLDAAVEALEYYAQFVQDSERGTYLPYSDQKKDNLNVYNVSSMLMAQYIHAGRLAEQPIFRAIADATAKTLWTGRLTCEHGDYWNYDPIRGRWNDSIHGAYVVQGIYDYRSSGGSAIPNPVGAIRMLRTYFRDGRTMEFASHPGISVKQSNMPARPWGVGMLAHTLSACGEVKLAAEIARSMEGDIPNDPRIKAHILFGLARLDAEARPWWRRLGFDMRSIVKAS